MVAAKPWRIVRRPDGSRWTVLGGQSVPVYRRSEFLSERWDYRQGEHVAIFGPTQLSGKTRLMFDLLETTDSSELSLPPTMLVAKPRDVTVQAGIARLGYTETDRWPARRRMFSEAPPGYAFWPKHLKDEDPKTNNEQLADKFRAVMHETFWKGNSITVADELYHLVAIFKMSDDINRHLTQGHGMGSALWYATQRPSGTQQGALSGFVFNSATHTFVARDPVGANRKKYADIGGVPTEIVEDATYMMPPFNFLYIHRSGPKLCIVEAK